MLSKSVKILILLSLILLLGVQQASAVAPVITLLEQNPAILYSNSSGNFSLIYGIAHDNSGLNLSSLALKWTIFDNNSGTYYHSIRVPNNNQSDIWDGRFIARAQNRNKSDPSERLNWETNVTITEGNVYKWAGIDENSSRIGVVSVNSTYTKIYLNATIQDTVTNDMWYVCRQELKNATKTEYEINKLQDLVVKIYDSEVMKGNDDNYVARIWLGTNIPGNMPSTSVDVYWGNYSWDPEGAIDIEDSPYGTYMTSFDATEWIDWTYQPDANANYIMFEAGAGADPIIPTNESYLVFKSSANSNSGFGIDITNVDTSSNVSFADTKVTWTGSDDSYTQYSYTPNIFVTFLRGNQTFKSMCYVQDNLGAWNNSTMHESEIHEGKFPPTGGGCDHFNFEGSEDENKDCTYRGTIGFQVFTASDPDGGTVTHNFTLRYANGTHIVVINNTYTNLDGSSLNISFDTSPYYSTTELYKTGCVATDDEGKTTERELLTNFSLSPLGTTGNILDSNRLIFWGHENVSELYNTVGNNDIISYTDGTYTFHKKMHMSQYEDTFNIMSSIHIDSVDNNETNYYRWTGICNIDGANLTSWRAGAPAPVTDEYRAYIYSDVHYSDSDYIINSDFTSLGKGLSPYKGLYLNHLSNTLIDNNLFSYNDEGISLVDASDVTLSNNTVSNCREIGLHITGGSGGNIIRDNIISNVVTEGIKIDSSDNTLICNNTVLESSFTGIKVTASNNVVLSYNSVTSNVLTEELPEYIKVSYDVSRCDNFTMVGNNGYRFEIGTYLKEMTNMEIINNTFLEHQYGVTVSGDSYNINISNNILDVNMDANGNIAYGVLAMYKEPGHLIINDNTITSDDGHGIGIWGGRNNVSMSNNKVYTSNPSYYDYYFYKSYNNTITDPADTTNTIGITDPTSDVTIKNTNNQVFIHSSSGTSYGYPNGSFGLFTNTQEDFTITNTPYTANFTSVAQLTAATPSINNVADFDIGSGNVDLIRVYNVQDDKNYVLKRGILSVQTVKSSGSTVLFTSDISAGSYTIGLSGGALVGATVIDNVYKGFEFGSIGLIAIAAMVVIMVVLLMLLAISGKVEIGYTAVITLVGVLCASAVAFGLFLYVMGYIT